MTSHIARSEKCLRADIANIVFNISDVALLKGNLWNGPNAPNDKERQALKKSERRATNKIMQLFQAHTEQLIREARINPFDFVEPCEPECSPERHAYHEGQWDMAERITNFNQKRRSYEAN